MTAGGCALAGDSSAAAAERELFEEIGLKVAVNDSRPHMTVNFASGFDDYYLLEAEVKLTQLKLQAEEVKAVKWSGKEEILQMIDSGEFIPYHKPLIKLLFDMRKRSDARSI